MKILQINTRYIGGGGAAEIANVNHKMIVDTPNHHSKFVYGRGLSDDEHAIKINDKIRVHISALVMRGLGRDLGLNYSSELIEAIEWADIVHLHNLHGYYLNYTELIEEIIKQDKKVIWTLHDTWSFTGRCAFTFKCEKWKTGCYDCSNKKIYPKTYIDCSKSLYDKKKSLFCKLDENNTTLITPSKWLKDRVNESYLSNYRVKVINNGIENMENIKGNKLAIREELNLPIDKKIVLFVAADLNDERKGIKYLLDIIKNFSEDTVFISVGNKIEEFEYDNFLQLGYIRDKEKLHKIYSVADVFVITSIDDNFPTTILEAFRAATPAIGFNVGGIKEQIINKRTGFLIDTEDSKQLEVMLKHLLENEEEIKTMGSYARKDFEEKYSIDIYKQNYLELIKNI